MDEKGGSVDVGDVNLSPGQQGLYPQVGAPYPQGGAPYPQSGTPYTQGGAPYTQAQYPAVVQQPGVQYMTGPPGGQTIIIQQSPEPKPNLAGHIAFSCIVFWLCNCLFGLIAFILAMVATSSADRSSARQLARASLGLSIAGLILGLVVIGVILGLYFTGAFTAAYYNDYDYYG